MELTALHLKGEGALMCRTLSYDNAEFMLDTVDVDAAMYDSVVSVWSEIWKAYRDGLDNDTLDITKQVIDILLISWLWYNLLKRND